MEVLFDLILWCVLAILAFNVGYLVLYGVSGLFYRPQNLDALEKKKKFAVFIPAYKGDEVILNSASELLKQTYPAESYDVIVIGDTLQPQTEAALKQMPLIYVPVAFENSTKAKSLNAAIDAVKDNSYDYAVIFDIDNVAEPAFLEKMNSALNRNQKAMQAHRLAKNEDTDFSILDGISEEINNHVFRKGHKVLGLSAAFIGSGKAIQYPYFVEIMRQITAIGGFDKQMEVLIISDRVTIDYAHNILIYDEKVQQPEVFQNQRKRWMSAQLAFMKQYAMKGILKGIFTGNIDLLDKSIQLILLPRLINLGLNIFFCAAWLLNHQLGIYFMYLLLIQIFFLLVCTPAKYYNQRTLKALMSLPYGFTLMFLNFFKLKGANKKFIHTPHSSGPSQDNQKK